MSNLFVVEFPRQNAEKSRSPILFAICSLLVQDFKYTSFDE